MKELIEPYILDSNIFVQASRVYYPFDFAKPFWDKLVKYAEDKRILSIDKVYDELMEGNDKLRDWADSEFKPYFQKAETIPITSNYRELILWSEGEAKYTQEAKDKFYKRETADAWVIAYAMTYNCSVVTSEALDTNNKVSIQMPVVCDAFDIPCCNTFAMLKKIGFSF